MPAQMQLLFHMPFVSCFCHLHAPQFRPVLCTLMQHALVLCHDLPAALLSQTVVDQVLEMSRDVSGGRERLGAAIDGAIKGSDPVSSNVSFKVMCPSAGRTANGTDMWFSVGTFMTTTLDVS